MVTLYLPLHLWCVIIIIPRPHQFQSTLGRMCHSLLMLLSRIVWWIAFGTNVFLHCHTDDDFTMSIIQVFLKGKRQYLFNNEVVVYFCFPTIGVAAPLRPGDYLLFNACIPYCISSRCKVKEEILCTSTYLKTAVVGMNNNDLSLTDEQTRIIEKFNSKR